MISPRPLALLVRPLLALAVPALCAMLAGIPAGCAERAPDAPPPTPPRIEPRPVGSFAFTSLDGQLVTGASLRGRMTVVALLASYDTASQAQARFLENLLRRHRPRLNVLGIVMERAEHQPLAQAFAASLGLSYPLAMADGATLSGRGPFEGLHHVPSVVLLDRQGREVWRKLGLVTADILSREIDQRDR